MTLEDCVGFGIDLCRFHKSDSLGSTGCWNAHVSVIFGVKTLYWQINQNLISLDKYYLVIMDFSL